MLIARVIMGLILAVLLMLRWVVEIVWNIGITLIVHLCVHLNNEKNEEIFIKKGDAMKRMMIIKMIIMGIGLSGLLYGSNKAVRPDALRLGDVLLGSDKA